MAPRLLHGTLYVTISGVEGLPAGLLGQSLYAVVALEVAKDERNGRQDLEVAIGRTKKIQHNARNQEWNEELHLYCAHNVSRIVLSIKNGENDYEMGRVSMLASELVIRNVTATLDVPIDGWWKEPPVCYDSVGLRVKLSYTDVRNDTNWDKGLAQKNEFNGVPFAYFRQNEGCNVTLYQDAHVLGNQYSQHRCWEDIFDAIAKAKHLIYITGWSVLTDITLIRDKGSSKEGAKSTLGKILKDKAEEDVKVLILIWEDKTDISVINEGGLMDTHGKETIKYFAGSAVKCILCPRDVSSPWWNVKYWNFSHHQKTVIVDTAITEDQGSSRGSKEATRRRIVSYVGGLDLCNGRYDTQSHSLFRTLGTDGPHYKDFYQNCFKKASIEQGGPRQPWHDIHCRLEGPIALDVLKNFEQRWKKQGLGEDSLANVRGGNSPIDLANVQANTWNAQLFRSIDELSAIIPNDDSGGVADKGLVYGRRGNLVEHSIQDAYINAIRRARRFIYIESQYFLGSSYGWINGNARDGAAHLIPKELSLKIVSKIEKEERFSVYIVIPMWPEGDPKKNFVQDILFWQRHTMNMMYNDVVKALEAKGITTEAKDYLSFFCLGNRENIENHASNKAKPHTNYRRAQDSKRFMIYVHSKMMIVDDEYIIVGSANINQRSMDGERDTEIAMGAFQPLHIAKEARGEVHGFRMSLWYEHMNKLDDAFLKPESLECIQEVNRLAKQNWELYMKEGSPEDDLPGHLLTYPIQLGKDGQVSGIDGIKHFPDMNKGEILGSRSSIPPQCS